MYICRCVHDRVYVCVCLLLGLDFNNTCRLKLGKEEEDSFNSGQKVYQTTPKRIFIKLSTNSKDLSYFLLLFL